MRNNSSYAKQNLKISSLSLNREVIVDIYSPETTAVDDSHAILFINDGQDMDKMGLQEMLAELTSEGILKSLVCVAIHSSENRKNEYGTAGTLDYMGRGDQSEAYQEFLTGELLPFCEEQLSVKLEQKAEIGRAHV